VVLLPNPILNPANCLVEILQAQTTRLQDDNARVVPGQKEKAWPRAGTETWQLAGCTRVATKENKPQEFKPG
jgi:hypothetical protein